MDFIEKQKDYLDNEGLYKDHEKNFEIYKETYNKIQETQYLKKAIRKYPKFFDIVESNNTNNINFNRFMLILLNNDEKFKEKKIDDLIYYSRWFRDIRRINKTFEFIENAEIKNVLNLLSYDLYTLEEFFKKNTILKNIHQISVFEWNKEVPERLQIIYTDNFNYEIFEEYENYYSKNYNKFYPTFEEFKNFAKNFNKYNAMRKLVIFLRYRGFFKKYDDQLENFDVKYTYLLFIDKLLDTKKIKFINDMFKNGILSYIEKNWGDYNTELWDYYNKYFYKIIYVIQNTYKYNKLCEILDYTDIYLKYLEIGMVGEKNRIDIYKYNNIEYNKIFKYIIENSDNENYVLIYLRNLEENPFFMSDERYQKFVIPKNYKELIKNYQEIMEDEGKKIEKEKKDKKATNFTNCVKSFENLSEEDMKKLGIKLTFDEFNKIIKTCSNPENYNYCTTGRKDGFPEINIENDYKFLLHCNQSRFEIQDNKTVPIDSNMDNFNKSIEDDTDNQCPICAENFDNNERKKVLPKNCNTKEHYICSTCKKEVGDECVFCPKSFKFGRRKLYKNCTKTSKFGKKPKVSKDIKIDRNHFAQVSATHVTIFDKRKLSKSDSDPQQSAYYKSIVATRKLTKNGTFTFRKKKYTI